MRLGILGSTRGTLMLDVIHAIQHHQLNAVISVVISNKSNAMILENAKKHGLNAIFVDPSKTDRHGYDHQLSDLLIQHKVDLVVLIGYMKILTDTFVNKWANKIINVHPSLLPAFSGLMDKQVHRAVLASTLKESGCTVHYVTEEVDAGPILLQKKCEVLPTDTVDELKIRVQALESVALIEAINKIIKDKNHE